MNEAIKIVKAKLNEALNKNDAKAVREACIVLQAMERKAIDMGQVDVEQEAKINQALQQNPPAIVERIKTPEYFINVKDLGDGTLEYIFEDRIEEVSNVISKEDISNISTLLGEYLAGTKETVEDSLDAALDAIDTLISKYADNTVINSIINQTDELGQPIINENRLWSYINQIIERSAEPEKLKKFVDRFGARHQGDAWNLLVSLLMLSCVIGFFVLRITSPED